MRKIGFSTGSLALGNFEEALRMLRGTGTDVVELSALRASELPVLAAAISDLGLDQFQYISVHAPSRWDALSEREGVEYLKVFAVREWPIILHPDCIEDYDLWKPFGASLLIENMDKRKPAGRTWAELQKVFDQLPEAGLCFDIGHARQVDPTMLEAYLILRRHGTRLRQVHMSHVDTRNVHVTLRWASIQPFQKIAHLIPETVPVILETPVKTEGIERELDMAREALSVPAVDLAIAR
jgi:sugar phosphate isomerase/epimerase